MSDNIDISVSDYVMTIRINRPDRKNALTADMYTAMADALEKADAESSVRVLLFIGSEGCFTAGNDLNDFLNNPPNGESAPVFRFISNIAKVKKPVIAAVDGAAVGVGVTMLLHCDMVFVTENAKLIMPFVDLGLLPEAGASLLLPRMLGHAKASEIIMLGEPISGAQAVGLGLANRISLPEALESDAMIVANKIAQKPPSAVRTTKKLLRSYADTLESQMATEGVLFREALDSPEAKEALTAFLEKRKPDFSQFD